jgi:hypothetical protein
MVTKTLLHITTSCINGVSPVESGKRATEKGYNKTTPNDLNGTWGIFRSGNKEIYSGIFFPNGHHMTWNYAPGNPKFPEFIKEGDPAVVQVVGIYEDDEVGCLIVNYNGEIHQP